MGVMADMILPADPTLDEVRDALAPLVARNAAFDGWTHVALDMAAQQAGMDKDIARLAFDGGPLVMIDAWFAHIDAAMLAHYPPEKLAPMKIRERITALTEARIDIASADREALRRAMPILAMPHNLVRATKLGWRTADTIWRAAGDTTTDYNHYTKRSLLMGIYSATMLSFINDESDDHGDTRAFLARRIDNVMQFEKAKARLSANKERRPSLARFVGRLRYHAR